MDLTPRPPLHGMEGGVFKTKTSPTVSQNSQNDFRLNTPSPWHGEGAGG